MKNNVDSKIRLYFKCLGYFVVFASKKNNLNYLKTDIVIRGGSNKQIELFDMNKLQVVQTYKDVHIKQPHVVRHSTVSFY